MQAATTPKTSDIATDKAYLQGIVDAKRALQQIADRCDQSGYSDREQAAYRAGWREGVRDA